MTLGNSGVEIDKGAVARLERAATFRQTEKYRRMPKPKLRFSRQ